MRQIFKRLFLFVALTLLPVAAVAQAPAQNELLKPEQLDQLVAPIALYPDALVSEVLMASTYPLEVVEAARWAEQNKSLKGEQLKQAADKQSWDDSVKSLTATPDVLGMMSSKLDWTQKLGDAVLAQQADIMDAVQRLRNKAEANGKLTTTSQQTVKKTRQANREVIVIEPTEPNTVYVPYYDPAVVYGAWPYPAYPPYAFAYPGYIPGAAIATGLAFSAGFAVGAWAWHDHYWGGGFNWGNRNINFNRQINVNNINVNNNWRHNPNHRHGVRYNNSNVAKQFSKAGNANRQLNFRGKDGKQVLNPNARRKGNQNTRNLSGQTQHAKKQAGSKGKNARAHRSGKSKVESIKRKRDHNAMRLKSHRSNAHGGGRARMHKAGGRRGGGGRLRHRR